MAAVHLTAIDDSALPALLAEGKVGVMPTDTIYGLAADAHNPQAVQKIGMLKGHGQMPGTVIAASPAQLIELGIEPAVVKKVAHLWPNSLSIELPLGPQLSHLFQQGPHRAFRVVADARLRALLEKTGPLLTSSANLHGEPAANTIGEAEAYFGDQADFYVEGGDLSGNLPSTIAGLRPDGTFEIFREGAVPLHPDGTIG